MYCYMYDKIINLCLGVKIQCYAVLQCVGYHMSTVIRVKHVIHN